MDVFEDYIEKRRRAEQEEMNYTYTHSSSEMSECNNSDAGGFCLGHKMSWTRPMKEVK